VKSFRFLRRPLSDGFVAKPTAWGASRGLWQDLDETAYVRPPTLEALTPNFLKVAGANEDVIRHANKSDASDTLNETKLPNASGASEAARASPSSPSKASSSRTGPPELVLSFEMPLNTSSGRHYLSADVFRRAISVRDLDDPAGPPYDSMIFDFKHDVRYIRQRFFDELVCYEMDLSAHRGYGNPSATAEYTMTAFRMVLGEIFGVPLESYTTANRSSSDPIEIVGRRCHVWDSKQAWRLHASTAGVSIGEALDSSGIAPPSWLERTVADQLNMSKLPNDTAGAEIVLELNTSFCVSEMGELLATNSSRRMSIAMPIGSDGVWHRLPIMDVQDGTFAMSAPIPYPNPTSFHGAQGVSGHCVNLLRGREGPRELRASMNGKARIARINSEAKGMWKAVPYRVWDGMLVKEAVPTLGTTIGPLRLPLGSGVPGLSLVASRPASHHRAWRSFDARAHWPECLSINVVRNQGKCGSCWAFAATSVLADRFCIAKVAAARAGAAAGAGGNMSLLQQSVEALQTLTLSPERLLECDVSNNGCGGGRLDSVWRFLEDHGVPVESCSPYSHCQMPNEPRCAYGHGEAASSMIIDAGANFERRCPGKCASGAAMKRFRASSAYAVAVPSDVRGLQNELFENGPVQVGFFVFSDFHNYHRGVYFRTPGAFGPLGGHAVRLVGWGVLKDTDYWLAANSWSPVWGRGGFFKIRRGVNECGIESTPAAGLPRLG